MVATPNRSTERSSRSHTPPFSLPLAHELLAAYGSPLYVYEGDRLRQTIQHITQAIPYPRTHCHFASVTNGNISLLQIFRDAGWGLHANTPGDIYLALHAGFHPNQIIYSGSNLNRIEMEQLFCWGITMLNLDSLAQLQLCCEVWRSLKSVEAQDPTDTLSFSPALPRAHAFILPQLGLRLSLPELTGNSRIGIHPDDFPAAISIAQQAGFQINGLHFYRGTGTNATVAFTEAIDTVITTAKQLPAWSYLDFGGGFGYPYRRDGTAFNWQQFGAVLSDRLSQLDRSIDLIIEPGRAAIADCATLLTKVVSVKWQDSKQIVGVDTTVANLSVPSVHGGYREIVTWEEGQEAEGRRQKAGGDVVDSTSKAGVNDVRRRQKERDETDDFPFPFLTSYPSVQNSKLSSNTAQSTTQNSNFSPTPHSLLPTPHFLTDVCGNTTYSRDYLGKNCQLPTLKMGDVLAVLDVGAYGYAMSSHFLHRPRPAEVLLEKGTHRLIRKRETYSTLIENQLFERHSPEAI